MKAEPVNAEPMKAEPVNAEPMKAYKRQVLSDITEVIHAVSDHVPPSAEIGMETLLVADLGLESIEIGSLFFMLRERYEDGVSVADFVLEVVDAGALSDLPVGRIVDFITGSARAARADSAAAAEPGAAAR
jgi:hypothetical protein